MKTAEFQLQRTGVYDLFKFYKADRDRPCRYNKERNPMPKSKGSGAAIRLFRTGRERWNVNRGFYVASAGERRS